MARVPRASRLGVFSALLLLVLYAFSTINVSPASAGGVSYSSGPQWQPGHYFPTFPSTSTIYAMNVTTALDDQNVAWNPSFRINSSSDTMMALTLAGMQGIINRDGPVVYLNWISNAIDGENASNFWLQLVRQNVHVVNEENLSDLEDIQFLYQHYGAEFAGAVVYDPNIPDTINVATMIAGLENLTILAPEQLGEPGMPPFSSVVDLRQLAASQDWNNTAAGVYKLYLWVYDNLWPKLEHRMIAVISPGPPTSGPCGGGNFYPLGIAARDYLVALRIPALWLSPTVAPQSSLLEQFLADAPSPIPIIGVYGSQETDSVALYSRYGDWEAAITRDNTPLSGGDLTVLSGVRPEVQQYESGIDIDRIFAALGNKPVITIWNSDGDNIEYQLDRGFYGPENWVWEDVQGHRFGWSINPMLADVAPLVWNYYVESARNVSFVSGLSGAGFSFPSLMNDSQLQAYLAHVGLYMNETGIRSLWVSDYFLYPLIWDNQLAGAYYDSLQNSGYLGSLTCDICSSDGFGFGYFGVPTPTVFTAYDLNSTNGPSIIKKIMSRQPGSDFIDLAQAGGSQIWYNSWGQVVLDASAFSGRALLFSTSSPGGLALATTALNLAPGNYTLTFRLKVSNDTSPQPIAQLYVGTITAGGGWDMVAHRYISPNEFLEAGKYQNFTLPFSLSNFTSNIEFRLDYYGGTSPPPGEWASTDMYADYITSDFQGKLGLPVFSAVFIPLVTNIQRLTEAPSLAENFEQAGGLTLTPDEFLASLNPQFMIQWATPILGANNEGLITARAQLSSGDYFGSLLTIRQALLTLPTRNYTSNVTSRGYEYQVTVGANSWITNIGLNQTSDELSFLTHGPPEGTAHVVITVPNGLVLGPLKIEVDGKTQAVTPVKDASSTTLSLTVSQGPHQIVVSLGAPAVTTATTTSSTASTTSIPASTTTATTSSTATTPSEPSTLTTSTSSLPTTSARGGIPEFPLQLVAVTASVSLIIVSYLRLKRRNIGA